MWNITIKIMNDMKNDILFLISEKISSDRNIKNYNNFSEYSWIVNEISAFLQKEYLCSYILMKYRHKCDYSDIDLILKNEFCAEYDDALKINNYEI